jgi:hypothetical protein
MTPGRGSLLCLCIWIVLWAGSCSSTGGGIRLCDRDADCDGGFCVRGDCVYLPPVDASLGDGGGVALDGGAPEGGGADGGSVLDGGTPADGGAVLDGGTVADGSPTDAGVPADGGPAGGALGADCRGDADCQSGVCLALTVSGQVKAVCARLCCTEFDCPLSDGAGNRFGCIELLGASYCLTDRIFSGLGVAFTRSAGQPCDNNLSAGGCRSGICRTGPQGERTCASTCCTQSDCGAQTCAFRPPYGPGELTHHVCELNLTSGRTGDLCTSELECASYVCLPPFGPACADSCCTAADCPWGYRCLQIESGPPGTSNVGTVCVPHGGGTAPAGSPCTQGTYPNQCASSYCVAGTCRDPCCRDDQCPQGQVCRAVDNGEQLLGRTQNGLARVCVTP